MDFIISSIKENNSISNKILDNCLPQIKFASDILISAIKNKKGSFGVGMVVLLRTSIWQQN